MERRTDRIGISISRVNVLMRDKNCFPTQNFTEIGQSAAELRPKTILNMTAVRHLEFLKIHIWSRDLQIPFLLMFFYQPAICVIIYR